MEAVRDLVWSTAEQVLLAGVDVVLDWNAWSRERRVWIVARAEPLNVDGVLHRLNTPLDVANQRLVAGSAPFAHPTTEAGNEHLHSLMEPVAPMRASSL